MNNKDVKGILLVNNKDVKGKQNNSFLFGTDNKGLEEIIRGIITYTSIPDDALHYQYNYNDILLRDNYMIH